MYLSVSLAVCAAASTVGVVGCDDDEPLRCTLMGYDDGLYVEAETSEDATEFSFNLSFASGDEPVVVDLTCSNINDSECLVTLDAGSLQFEPSGYVVDGMVYVSVPREHPSSVTISASVVAAGVSRPVGPETFELAYDVSEPNGEGCGEARVARVSFDLGGVP